MSLATRFVTAAAAAGAVLSAATARADGPDPGAAVVTGAAAFVVGFAAGGVALATARGSNAQSNAGWLAIESGFALAPLAAHAVVGEWGRGLAFAAPPAAAIGGTVALFGYDGGTILSGSLGEQRVMWTLFGLGLFSGVAGIVDAGVARARAPAVAVAPLAGPGSFGLAVGGAL